MGVISTYSLWYEWLRRTSTMLSTPPTTVAFTSASMAIAWRSSSRGIASLLTTNTTPSTRDARTAASVTAISGGESNNTKS